MRNSLLVVSFVCFFAVSGSVQARDTKHLYPISSAMNTPAAKEQLSGSIQFHFGDKTYTNIAKDYGVEFTNKKTNAFNKSDKVACEWVFLSAMLRLQEKAQQLGANAVVNIHSYYKKVPFVSETKYECHAGAIIAGVALRGRFVRLSGSQGSGQSTVGYESKVREAQQLLAALGYDPGPPDGLMGRKTSGAIKEFQSDKGLLATGELDRQTIAAIRNAGSSVDPESSTEANTGKESGGVITEGSEVTSEESEASGAIDCSVEDIVELKESGMDIDEIERVCR